MNEQPEITRTFAIEHAGEKIHITVHVYLTPEEIRRVIVPAVGAELARQVRYAGQRSTRDELGNAL